MAALCTSLSFIHLSSSSKFPTNFFVDAREIKSFSVSCEATNKHLNNPFRSQEFQHYLNENKFPVAYLMQYKEKVEHVKQLLKSKEEEEDRTESLMLVDAIQRLGVAHHYQEEIRTILDHHYVKTGDSICGYRSLYEVALTFRLLRQQGYHVSSDVFNNFKGKDGRFKGELKQDIEGLLELYEATQLSYQGEYILDEAEEFSRQLLHESLANTHNKWSNIVAMRLKHPYHKSLPRLTEHKYLKDLASMNGWRKTLTEVAEIDFSIGQSIHQRELHQVSMWWDDLGLTRELKLVRNQPLEWYIWSMAAFNNDISLSVQRVELTKSIALGYLIDDIFDVYGTLEELTLFTEAVSKWDYEAMDMLPDYMKMCYTALLDTTNEIGNIIHENYGYNPIKYLKQTWRSLCNAFLVEAKWFVSGDLPRAHEYLANGKVSSGADMVLVHLFFLLGLGGDNEGANNLDDTTTIISCVATIVRLWDDLGNAKDEHQNGEDGSYIECYMKDHQGLPFNEARKHVVNMIENEWKCLNKECFHLNHSTALPFKEASLNLARMVSLIYSYDDNQRLPFLEQCIKFMLLDQTSPEHHQTKREV